MRHCMRQTVIALRLADMVGASAAEREATYYLGLMMNVYCHADAAEQAQWFGDDISFKGAAFDALDMSAEPADLSRRLAARGRPTDDLAAELASADALDRAFATDPCVDTIGLTVAEVVDRVRARTGWPDLAAPVEKPSPTRQGPDPRRAKSSGCADRPPSASRPSAGRCTSRSAAPVSTPRSQTST